MATPQGVHILCGLGKKSKLRKRQTAGRRGARGARAVSAASHANCVRHESTALLSETVPIGLGRPTYG
jgi:hypothetical protein